MKLKPIQHIIGILGVLLGLVIAFPMWYGFALSFMSQSEIVAYPPRLIPSSITFKNYAAVFAAIPIMRFILNSLIVSAAVIFMQILTSSLAAYGFVFFDFPFKKTLFIAVLATMMIPGEATIISNYLTMASQRMLDTYLGLILPFCASAMAIFMIRQNYMSLPRELREAAAIDGCGDFRFFVSILFPLSMPVVSALAVYTFIGTWNQFMWPLLITSKAEMRTVQIGISMLQYSDGINFGLVCAGCCIILGPTAAMFVLCHKKLVTGITAGSVKG